MSQLTFNIEDYRPLHRVRAHDHLPAEKPGHGFVVFSSNSEPAEYDRGWFDAPPAVVEIRSVRELHRSIPRRGKILRFSNPASHRVYMMPSHESFTPEDDDPGPMVA